VVTGSQGLPTKQRPRMGAVESKVHVLPLDEGPAMLLALNLWKARIPWKCLVQWASAQALTGRGRAAAAR